MPGSDFDPDTNPAALTDAEEAFRQSVLGSPDGDPTFANPYDINELIGNGALRLYPWGGPDDLMGGPKD